MTTENKPFDKLLVNPLKTLKTGRRTRHGP